MSETLFTPLAYETRNLGVDSFAVSTIPAKEDDTAALAAALARMAAGSARFFVQAKCTLQEFHGVRLLEQVGFRFVETALVPMTIFAKNDTLQEFLTSPASFLPGRYPLEELTIDLMDGPAEEAVVRSIAGESFTRDRFHMDPCCSEEAANRRYINWVDDLLTDPAVTFHLLRHREEVTGFLARRGEHLVLAGFARRYTGSGLGDFLWLSVLKIMQEEGLRQAHTQISAANTAVLNLYVRLSFKFRDPLFLLHFWGKQ